MGAVCSHSVAVQRGHSHWCLREFLECNSSFALSVEKIRTRGMLSNKNDIFTSIGMYTYANNNIPERNLFSCLRKMPQSETRVSVSQAVRLAQRVRHIWLRCTRTRGWLCFSRLLRRFTHVSSRIFGKIDFSLSFRMLRNISKLLVCLRKLYI